jgi:hypothetical protein
MHQEIDSFVKGAIAEMLVTQLFLRSGYRVKLFGSWKAGNLDDRSFQVDCHKRSDHPDLVIFDGKKNKELIEVKFIRRGTLVWEGNSGLRSQCWYWHQQGVPFFVVIVNDTEPPYFRVLDWPYQHDGRFVDLVPIMDAPGLKLKRTVYEHCELLIKQGVFKWG